ncbi:uncharacterized protein VTP21DRAFT_6133 [Calcarisporiella thermophila]|uniref:uncharacterized protein n=1 Tax=Calcarisporiella thermophila TaxID=911321 RepID=UPI0037448670
MNFAITDGELAINFASVFCGALIMILVVFLRYTQPQATRSISFKLSFWIGLSDALYRSFYIIYVANDFVDAVMPNNLWLGRIIFWSFHFFPIWFSLLTVSIAFDLQLSTFQNKLTVQRYQKWYLPVSTLVAFGLCSPTLFYGGMGYDPKQHRGILDWPYEANLIRVVVFITVISLCLLYSFTIIFFCAIKVFSMVFRVRREKDLHGEKNRLRERLMIMSVLRLLGYPAVLILCMPAECIMHYLIITNTRNTSFGDSTGKAKAILTGMIGILNLIIFLFNPAFSGALSNFKIFKDVEYMKYWNRTAAYTDYAKKYPHLQQIAENAQADAKASANINKLDTGKSDEPEISRVQEQKILPNQHLLDAKRKEDRILIPFSSGISDFSTR